MRVANDELRQEITDYCVLIGNDFMLVQGAGGNISWKEGEILWVKASGTWLVAAKDQDIFVPVNLKHIQQEVTANNFNALPIVLNNSNLRPSIETLLHAIFPHKVVLHLHAIDILSHLVRVNGLEEIAAKLGQNFKAAYLKYFKPGKELAEQLYGIIIDNPDIEVVFLQNHGIILAGDNIDYIAAQLDKINNLLKLDPSESSKNIIILKTIHLDNNFAYKPILNDLIQQLAINELYFLRLLYEWALYPDHVVFLGPQAFCFATEQEFREKCENFTEPPKVIFIKNCGVFYLGDLNRTMEIQLLCYAAVITRQWQEQRLLTLNYQHIAELLNWDAEHYRQSLEKGA